MTLPVTSTIYFPFFAPNNNSEDFGLTVFLILSLFVFYLLSKAPIFSRYTIAKQVFTGLIMPIAEENGMEIVEGNFLWRQNEMLVGEISGKWNGFQTTIEQYFSYKNRKGYIEQRLLPLYRQGIIGYLAFSIDIENPSGLYLNSDKYLTPTWDRKEHHLTGTKWDNKFSISYNSEDFIQEYVIDSKTKLPIWIDVEKERFLCEEILITSNKVYIKAYIYSYPNKVRISSLISMIKYLLPAIEQYYHPERVQEKITNG